MVEAGEQLPEGVDMCRSGSSGRGERAVHIAIKRWGEGIGHRISYFE